MIKTTIVYAIIFIISLFFCRIFEKKNLSPKKKIIVLMGIMIPPILLASVRYLVGIDYLAYIINYNGIVTMFSPKMVLYFYSKEPLYVITTYIGYLLVGTFTGAFWIYSIIYIFFVFEGIRYYKNKISITLGLFIFYMTYYLVFFNMIRQMIAVAIILFASRYIFEKKFWKYFIWIIIAGLFHKSAYIMIFLYLLNYKLDSKRISKIFFILATIAPIFMIPLLKIIIWFDGIIGIFTKYSSIDINLNLKFLLYVVPTLLFIMFYRKKILELDIRYELFIRIVFLQLPAQFLGCFVETADRISVYFAIFQVILIPLVLKTQIEESKLKELLFDLKKVTNFKEIVNYIYIILNDMRWKKVIIVGWYIFYYIVIFILMNSNGVYPYQTIFSMKEFPIDKIIK